MVPNSLTPELLNSYTMNKRILGISIIIALFAGYLHLFPFHEEIPLKKRFAEFPLQWQGWSGRDFYFDEVVLDKLRVSEYISRDYRKGDHRVGLYIGYYGTQREGAQIHSPKHCLPGSGWQLASERVREMDVDKVGKVRFVEAVYQKGGTKEVFIYWYQMKGAYITNEYLLKMTMVTHSLRYRRNDAAFIRLSAPVTSSVEATTAEMEGFMREFLPLLSDYLPS